jgi:hypothetical protein
MGRLDEFAARCIVLEEVGLRGAADPGLDGRVDGTAAETAVLTLFMVFFEAAEARETFDIEELALPDIKKLS